jgi:hypothetical protein
LKYFHFIIWWYVNYSNNYIFARRYTYFNENSFNYIFYICFKVFTNIILQLFWNIYTNTVGILLINVSLSLILLISPLKDNSATSTIWIKSSQGHTNPPLVRAEIKVFVTSVDFMTCNKVWISSLDWAFFVWFLWTSFTQNMDILRVKLVHKTEQRKASPTIKFKPYCKPYCLIQILLFLLDPEVGLCKEM